MEKDTPRIHKLKENPSARVGLPPYELLVREVPKAPQTILLCLVLLVVCWNKALLLQTPYALTAGHGDEAGTELKTPILLAGQKGQHKLLVENFHQHSCWAKACGLLTF